ncbi:MAG TPA: NO-inducible flavohemoprotein [Edaphobacter sp.]|nr:NO-inducible flavohemoprotein [Edaphobacter sp.]
MLTDQQRAIIRDTVPALKQHGEAITKHFYLSLFKENPGLLNIFNKANQREGGQAANLAASILMYAAHIDHLDKLGGMVERIAHKHGSMEVQPEHYPIVGDHLLRAIRQILGEAATDEVIAAWADAYGILADIMINRESQLYTEGAEKDGGWRGFKPFKVQKKVHESTSITSFYLVPEDGAPIPPFSPGQFLSIKLKAPSDPNEQIRQYSLSCTPNPEFYRISVGRERSRSNNILAPDGVVSNYLHDQVMAGDTLFIHMPLGDFVLDETSSQPVVLISGGIGITPMLSMLEQLAECDRRNVTFIHGTANRAQHAFGKHIREIARNHSNVKAVIFYNEVEEDDNRGEHHDESGYIDASMLRKHLSTLDADFYFCGPIPFLRAIEDALDQLGVPVERRRSEAFAPDPTFLLDTEAAIA